MSNCKYYTRSEYYLYVIGEKHLRKRIDYKEYVDEDGKAHCVIHGLLTQWLYTGEIQHQAYFVNGILDELYVGYTTKIINGCVKYTLVNDPRKHD